jgi:hypothetical protein
LWSRWRFRVFIAAWGIYTAYYFGSMDQERVLNLVVHGVAPRATL